MAIPAGSRVETAGGPCLAPFAPGAIGQLVAIPCAAVTLVALQHRLVLLAAVLCLLRCTLGLKLLAGVLALRLDTGREITGVLYLSCPM